MYVQVVVTRPTHRRPAPGEGPIVGDASRLITYTYRLPERLRQDAAVGHLVLVPLQHATALGVILAMLDTPPAELSGDVEIRDVDDLLDPLPVVTPAQIELARWIAGAYLAPLNQAIRLFLPPGLEDRTYVLVLQAREGLPPDLARDERAALSIVQRARGQIRLSTLLSRIGGEDPEETVHALEDRGLIATRHQLVPPRAAPPRIEYVRLLADDASIHEAVPRLGRASKQADALLVLGRHTGPPLSLEELCERAECTEGPVRALADRGWVEITGSRTLVVALPGAQAAGLARAPRQAQVLAALLRHGRPVDWSDLAGETGASSSIVASLEEKGLVRRFDEPRLVLLKLSPAEVRDRVVELRGAGRHVAVLSALRGTTGRVWVGGLYAQTGADLAVLRALADRGLISLHAEEVDRLPLAAGAAPPHLTPGQAEAWRRIDPALSGPPSVTLLHGVTGSGKTELYLRALESTLAAGKRAVVLVPEISLTAQTVRRFEARFPGRVAILHSQLTLGQRYAAWDRVRRGEADVVIGPRSALLAPVSRLGLIVLDESHDDSYKQTEPIPLPPYHARDTAVALGRIAGAHVLLGSATPDVVTYYRATAPGEPYTLIELPKRIVRGAPGAAVHSTDALPPVRVVDLRHELRAGNRSILSRALQEALRATLAAGEQAILFLNRRGAATFVLCRDCGYVARCPNCDVPLTYHHLGEGNHLVCHHCGHREPPATRCPRCGGTRIRYFGLGTERVEEAVQELYPDARLLRWDSDTASGADHDRYLQAFVDRRADVLVGTQMIAKGLDLPLVTLVGVISADTALYLPDYRAAERTFQLLTQVAGRAGRTTRGGRVIVQTYDPDHYAIQAASRHDYAAFYRRELSERRTLGYPPFSHLVALRYTHQDPHLARIAAERLGRWLRERVARTRPGAPALSLIGPVPAFYSILGGRHRWQIILRGHEPTSLLRDVALPRGWTVDVDPVSLL